MFFQNHMFPIIPNSKIFFAISGSLVFGAILAISTFGLPMGIDFTGGTRLQVRFENLPAEQEVSTLFRETLGAEQSEKIIKVLDKNDYLIKSKPLSEDQVAKLQEAFTARGWTSEIVSNSTTSPSVGAVFQERAFIATILAVIAITLYVAFAFRKVPQGISAWKFGIATIIALAHDIIIIIGFFAILGIFRQVEIDNLFVMALLTVLGFSVNDTIVIFDRIRERLKGEDRKHFPEIAERALWESMRRSINTSLSVFFILAALTVFFVSYESLFLFFLALSLGLIVGTYSSIFLASPLLVLWNKK